MKAILSAALVIGLCGIADAQGDKADPVGTWKCEYEIGGMKRMSTLTIKKDGDKLAGTMSWPDQKETNLKDVKLKDGNLSFSAFWSGQLIVPASLSPSFVIVSVEVRFWSPMEYSHFHVPTGSAFSPCAPARPPSPITNAAERIAFMFASKKSWAWSRPTRTASSR